MGEGGRGGACSGVSRGGREGRSGMANSCSQAATTLLGDFSLAESAILPLFLVGSERAGSFSLLEKLHISSIGVMSGLRKHLGGGEGD